MLAPALALVATFISPFSTPSRVVKELSTSLVEARISFKQGVKANACYHAGMSASLAYNISGVMKNEVLNTYIVKPATEALTFKYLCGIGEYKAYGPEMKAMAPVSDKAISELNSILTKSSDYDQAPKLDYSLDTMNAPLQLLNIENYDHKKNRLQLCFAVGILKTEVSFFYPMFKKLDAEKAMSLDAHVSRLKDNCSQNTMTEVEKEYVTRSIIQIYALMNSYEEALKK